MKRYEAVALKDGFLYGTNQRFCTKGQKYDLRSVGLHEEGASFFLTDDTGCDHYFDPDQEWFAVREIEINSFGDALNALKAGKKVARKGWNGKGIFIELQRPDEYSKMTHPYIFIDTTGLQTDNPHAPKNRVPWAPSQTDMLAEDWIILD